MGSYYIKQYSDTASMFISHDIEVEPSPYEQKPIQDFFLRKRLYHEVISIKNAEEAALRLSMIHYLDAHHCSESAGMAASY